MPFKEGSEVKKGALLFTVDPRPYQAQLDQAESQLNLYTAQLDLANVTYTRFSDLSVTTPGAVSKQALDQYKAQVTEAQAQVKADQSSLEVYRLNMEFSHVTSPIDGQVSRYYLTLGNLVNQDQTLLTTVVSLDPMYAYFDVDEPTLLRFRRAINEGKIKLAEDGKIPVLMGLQGEEGFPHPAEGPSTSSTTRSTRRPAASRCAASFPTPSRREGCGCCRRGCSCASACRWASRIRRCW